MGTIIIGSSANRKGITVDPSEVFFNGNVVKSIISGLTEIWSDAKPLVPIMTSNTAPYGEASAGSTYTQGGPYYEAYRAFDGSDSTTWASIPETMNGDWLQYKFNSPTMAKRAVVRSTVAKSYVIQASNNGSEWVNVSDTITTMSSAGENHDIDLSTDSYYFYYRIQITSKHVSNSINVSSLQFYGRQLVGLVPTMTSNTTPYGVASSSAPAQATEDAWAAFSDVSADFVPIVNTTVADYYIQYGFNKEVACKAVTISARLNNPPSQFYAYYYLKVQASNDGIVWDDVSNEEVNINSDSLITKTIPLLVNKKYKYYRVVIKDSNVAYAHASGVGCIRMQRIQFYGDKPLFEPLIPVMTSNTTPSGVASASTETANAGGVGYAYKAFTGEAPNATTGANYWYSVKTSGEWLEYKFERNVVVKMVKLSVVTGDANKGDTIQLKVQAYCNNEWVDISNVETCTSTGTAMTPRYITCNNDISSTRIRILRTGGTCEYTALGWVQYYD